MTDSPNAEPIIKIVLPPTTTTLLQSPRSCDELGGVINPWLESRQFCLQ